MKHIVQLTTQDVTSAMPVTTSLIIANEFGKRHDHVLRDIKKLTEEIEEVEKDDPKFGESYFVEESSYVNQQNKEQPMYLINEDFWMLLVMGYNGKKALQIKTGFIKAFKLMKNELTARTETRHIGKAIRFSLTDAIRDHVAPEGNFKKFAYSNYTKLVYKKVLGMDVKTAKEKRGMVEGDNLRDFLTIPELEKVQAMESKIAVFIEMSDTTGKNDKEIYQMVKEWMDKEGM